MGLIRRAVSLAAIPVTTGARMAGAAASSALGADKDSAYAKATLASAEAITATLAKARGPVMKFGQTLALFSQILPPEQAAMLKGMSRLYEDAQAQPYEKVEKVLAVLPDGVEVERIAVAAASLGQVHRAVWTDGSPVAIKVQYPDAARAVKSDMLQLRAMLPLAKRMLPSLDVGALLEEHASRLAEELDYTREAGWMRTFRAEWHDQDITIPEVLFATPKVLVTRWMDGTPWLQVADLPEERRNRAGELLSRFMFLSPARVGATHADPHPGNYRLLEDDTLGVLDFGSVAVKSGAFTWVFAETIRLAAQGDDEGILRIWQNAGLVGASTTAERLMSLLDVDTRLWTEPEFDFTIEWLGRLAGSWTDPVAALEDATALSFPPSYLLEHRALMGALTLVCSVGSKFRAGDLLRETLDTYAEEGLAQRP